MPQLELAQTGLFIIFMEAAALVASMVATPLHSNALIFWIETSILEIISREFIISGETLDRQ